MLKITGILGNILTSCLASDGQIFEMFKCLFLTIKHNFCVKRLFMVIKGDHFQKHSRWVPHTV